MKIEVNQFSLDKWRAYAEQNRTDLFTLRQLVAHGQREGAIQLIGSMVDQSTIAGLSMEDAGAARPAHLPPRPAPGTYIEEEDD